MILRELGFMVYVELPHKYIPTYVKALKLDNDTIQQAWNFTNDRYTFLALIIIVLIFS